MNHELPPPRHTIDPYLLRDPVFYFRHDPLDVYGPNAFPAHYLPTPEEHAQQASGTPTRALLGGVAIELEPPKDKTPDDLSLEVGVAYKVSKPTERGLDEGRPYPVTDLGRTKEQILNERRVKLAGMVYTSEGLDATDDDRATRPYDNRQPARMRNERDLNTLKRHLASKVPLSPEWRVNPRASSEDGQRAEHLRRRFRK
jgi:hypothetical protein